MAKFTNKDLRLKDNQKVTWGDSLDANIWWDGENNQLKIDTTISGVTPTDSYHLTTKDYVDNATATLSGSMVLDHSGLIGLENDDHTQYILTDGSRGFTNTISGITPSADSDLATKGYIDGEISSVSGNIITDHGGLGGLSDDDHTQYILADGSRSFTGVVGGVTPIEGTHLTTKDYVDLAIQGLDWQQSVDNFWTPSTGLPVAPSSGIRYVADDSGNGWTVNYIYTWVEDQWTEVIPNEGFTTWFETPDTAYTFNGTAWVRFGSTITHNNTNGIQGGTTDQYYHLTSIQVAALTDNGASVDDASSQHHHDSSYYTETEMNITISGLEADITTYSDHGNLTGLSDDDHTQYILADGSRGFTSTVSGTTPSSDSDLATKGYIDGEISSVSSTIITDHGGLDGLSDDDHTQYILADGSRGFSNTVSGVTPINSYDLATKAYVDGEGTTLRGRAAISDGAATVTVNFSDVGHTNYTVNITMENTADSPPSIYMFIVTAKTSNSFTVIFTGDMDSANYFINWTLIED